MTHWSRMIKITKAVSNVIKASTNELTVDQIVEIAKRQYPNLNIGLFNVRDALVRLAVRQEIVYPQHNKITNMIKEKEK